jgi:hypothetical protein
MAHVPDTQLKAHVDEAARQIPLGSTYAHYKHPEQHYRIDGFCILEGTDDIGILYTALYGAGVTYCRPLGAFLEHVAHEGAFVRRFVPVQQAS